MFREVEPVTSSPLMLISGEPGSGKTHLALTIAKEMRVYFLDSENRGEIVANKSPYKKNILYKPVSSYEEVREALGYIYKVEKEPVAILYDSGTDIQHFAELHYKEVSKVEKIYPKVNWSHIYDLMDNVIIPIRRSPHFLIVTSRMKEEYINDSPTGKKTIKIYSRLPYWADVILELEGPDKLIKLKKNGYGMTQEIDFPQDTLSHILDKIKQLN